MMINSDTIWVLVWKYMLEGILCEPVTRVSVFSVCPSVTHTGAEQRSTLDCEYLLERFSDRTPLSQPLMRATFSLYLFL